jgi:phospholipid transport system substrate-binding protein
MRARRCGVLALVAGLVLAVIQPAGAASPTDVLESFFEGANAILKTVDPFGDLDVPRQAVRSLVNDVFDFRAASAQALGPAWLSRTPAEQDEFVELFAVFLERGFIGMIGSKASVSDGVKIQFVDESIGEDWAGVATSLLSRSGQELPVDYWFVRSGDRWKIQDVVIDGVSLISNYRSQFTRILGAYPYSEILARLKGTQPEATAAIAESVAPLEPPLRQAPPPRVPAAPPIPPVPVVRQSPWLASVAVPPPTVPASLMSRTFQEIQLAALPSERSPSERVRAPSAAPVPEIREAAVQSREPQAAREIPAVREFQAAREAKAAGAFWIQLGVFQSENAAAHLAERFRRDGATISKTWLTNAAGNRVGVWARVRVGPFANRSEAQSKLQDLSARGQAGFIAETRD